MNGRRQLLGAVGLGSLLAGVTAVVPGFAATAKPRPTSHISISPNATVKRFQFAGCQSPYIKRPRHTFHGVHRHIVN